MEINPLLSLYDHEQRIAIEEPGMRKDVLPDVVRFVRPAPGMSFILYHRLDESRADAAIQEQVSYFTQINQPFEWKVYDHDSPPGMVEKLQAHGFVVEDPDSVMCLDLESAPASLLKPIQADVRPITRPDKLEDVIAVESQVWGRDFSWIRSRQGEHLAIPGYLNIYVAYADGIPACTGWVYFHPHSPFADLWGGSTVEAYRGQGLYTAILAVRVQEAIRRGVRYLVIDASPMSRTILEKHGFQLLTYAHACEWQPPVTEFGAGQRNP
jgi:GNAT superfamily N-acetyltransferase